MREVTLRLRFTNELWDFLRDSLLRKQEIKISAATPDTPASVSKWYLEKLQNPETQSEMIAGYLHSLMLSAVEKGIEDSPLDSPCIPDPDDVPGEFLPCFPSIRHNDVGNEFRGVYGLAPENETFDCSTPEEDTEMSDFLHVEGFGTPGKHFVNP